MAGPQPVVQPHEHGTSRRATSRVGDAVTSSTARTPQNGNVVETMRTAGARPAHSSKSPVQRTRTSKGIRLAIEWE